jgi:beta-lactamase regulating signal transducer with metallopeptidase domain
VSLLAASYLIPNWIVDLSPKLVGHLVDPALRTLGVAALAGLTLVLARDKSWSLRFSVWKVVVCAALAMPILANAMPPLAVALPFLDRLPEFTRTREKAQAPAIQAGYSPNATASVATSRPVIADARLFAAGNRAMAPQANGPATSSPNRSPNGHSFRVPWFVVASAVYAAVATYLAFRFLLGWFLSRRLRVGARTITEPNAVARFEAHARAARLRSVPRMAESNRLTVPLTCGVWDPVVLFPADWRSWDTDTLDAVMVHEISHVARRDALTERLALLHRTIFWFSPLSWWLRHRLSELAEEASDQAALAAGAEPTKYAEILLGFFEDLNSVTHRAEWQGVAMAQAGRAEKRLERILKGRMVVTTKIKKSLAAVVVFASIPVIMVSASMQPRRMGKQIVLSASPAHSAVTKKAAQEQKPSVPPVVATPAAAPVVSSTPAPEALPAAAPVAAATAEVASVPAPRAVPVPAVRAVSLQSAAAAPVPATPPTPAVAPVPAPAPRAFAAPAPPDTVAPAVAAHRGYSYSYSTDGDDSYAIISAGSSTMSGSFAHADFEQLEALRGKLKTDFIWFERNGKSYVITDPATVKRASEAFAAQGELGRLQGELGEKQGALGEAQGALGQQQGALGEQMGELHWNLQNLKVDLPDLTAEMQALREKSQELRQVLSEKDLEEIRNSVAQMEQQISEAQREMAKAQADTAAHAIDSATMEKAMSDAREALEQQMEKFSAEQEKLSTQQEILGKKQEELGREQEKAAAKAQAEIKAIIDDSLARGTAQPAPKP